ncbi:hypothetical protein [Brumimicrobium aurantiacum]|uniref:Uncharacterized protein n=1 Tax=Brumimicrobium aurantiacum TaxID=1737063 RepID=A0A3E1F0T3_9FLAO|nr:hypothetical protein [Brumimicrobium aurantiacum]RFC55424.1 hypothetical protein DXU93_00375 [Brumimicrobium aurantiacum]
MMKILYLFLLFTPFLVNSQTLCWKLEQSFQNSEIEAWDITPLGEIVYSKGGNLFKLDTNLNQAFTQSRKDFGLITKIDARHSLKALLFSENQQMIGFVDNTLAFQEGKVDLASVGIGYGTHVCYSNQTNRFWVYDEQNARLVRFEGIQSTVAQSEISNLMNITYSNELVSMIEKQNQLFLFYEDQGVFVFDYYGSLLRKFDTKEALNIYPTEKFLYILEKKDIIRLNIKSGVEERIALPQSDIIDLKVFGNVVYFKLTNGISKYSLIPQP